FDVRDEHARAAAARARQFEARWARVRRAAAGAGRAGDHSRRAEGSTSPRDRDRAVRAGCRPARPHSGDGMIDLSLLPDAGVRWLDASGPHGDIVLSTRVRLARNIEGFAFTGRARDGERLRVLAQVRDALNGVDAMGGHVQFRVDELQPVDRALLHERHLVSKELAGLDTQHPLRTGAAVFLGDRLGVMVNEEDHLRLQALQSGFALQQAYASLDKLDRSLGSRVPYSYHSEFGFLTACPTNVGTGLRASVLIHLPGLVLT